MKNSITLAFGLSILVIAATITPTLAQEEAPSQVLITNVNVWDGTSDRVQPGVDVPFRAAVNAAKDYDTYVAIHAYNDEVFAASLAAAAPDAAARQKSEASAILESIVEEGRVEVPGVAVSVFRDQVEVYRGAAGLADVEGGIDAEPDTRFRVYSTSKSLTAAAAFSLAERGVLDLAAPIGRYLPDLPADKQPITTRQLLAHRGGIRHYRDGEWISISSRQCTDPLEALSDFIDDPLIHAPGTATQYTSFGYVLISAVLQAAAEAPFAELMQGAVFTPAGMASIAIEGVPLEEYPIAEFYLRKEDETSSFVSTSTMGINASCKFGGGGFVGGARDLAAFGSALIDGRIISSRSLADMSSVVTPAPDDGSYPPMAYGIFAEDPFPGFPDFPPEETSRAVWHGGSARGGYSVMIAYPEKGVSVGLVSNVNAGGWLIFKAHDIAQLWWPATEGSRRYCQLERECLSATPRCWG